MPEKASSDRMNYQAFGQTFETPKDDVGYTGHKFDADLNLNYMQARYYDPEIGRFYGNDPVGFTGEIDTFNRYSYVANNPYKYTDPNGEIKESRFKVFAPKQVQKAMVKSSDGAILKAMGQSSASGKGIVKEFGNVVKQELGEVKSRIKENPKLVKEAETAGKSQQAGIDNLTNQLSKGNLNPGIGTKPIGQGLSEARHRSGARVYFKENGNAVEILGKSDKANQSKVITEVKKTFGHEK